MAISVVGARPPGRYQRDGDPDGVADEAVGELEVEVGAQHAGVDAVAASSGQPDRRGTAALRSAR